MHSKFSLRPHHVWKYGIDIQCPTAEIRRGNKKKDRKKKPQDENIYVHILLCRAAINKIKYKS